MHFAAPFGGIISVLPMLPNLLWMLLPGKAVDAVIVKPRWLEWAEQAARLPLILLPFWFPLQISTHLQLGAAGGALFCLLLYYGLWLRYFLGGRVQQDLFRSCCGLPYPMAVIPCLYFLLCTALLHVVLLVPAVLFSVFHLLVTHRSAGEALAPSTLR